MCRRYKLVWECDCDYQGEQPVVCCPTSDYVQVNPDTPPHNPKLAWIEASETDIDPRYLACFGTTWENPIELEMKRTCYDCPVPSDTGNEYAMPFNLGKELCLELLTSDVGVSIFLPLYNFLVDFYKLISWRSLYEQSRWWGDLSIRDLEYVNLATDAVVGFLGKVGNARTHFGLEVLPEALSSNVAEAQDFLVFLKEKLAYNLLLTKDDEASRTKTLLTKVALETLEKEDRECFVCFTNFGEDKDGVVEDAVKTPCHHTIGEACAKKWFVQENHVTCPICRTSLPRFL